MEHVGTNNMLLVDPESNCRLFNIDTGIVWWKLEGDKPLLYQYHHPSADDYLTIVCREDGTMDLCRHIVHRKEIVWCKKEKDMEEFLNEQYGEKLRLVVTSECFYLDGEDGLTGEESGRKFLIARTDYKMNFFGAMPYDTTIVWQLNFSRFKAFYPQSDEELRRRSIQVFHKTDKGDFYQFCTNLTVQSPPNISILKKLTWKLPQNKDRVITMTELRVGESNMFFGNYKGFEVAVEKLPTIGDLSKHARNLRELGAHDNILGFIEAQTNGAVDMFAFDITFISTLKKSMNMLCDTTKLRTSWEFIKILRGLINGLQFLHIHRLYHGNLKLHNVFIKDNYTVKLAGLCNIPEIGHGDLSRCVGKIVLNMMTDGRHGNEDGVPRNLEDILKNFEPRDEEVKDLLAKVLQQNYEERPSFEEISLHPVLFDSRTRVELVSELSDFCELKKREEQIKKVRHVVVKTLDDDVGPKVFENKSWREYFPKRLLDEANARRARPYDYSKLTDLVRFFRNIISHLSEISKSTTSCGSNKNEVELIFRQKFPNFFSEILKVA